MPGRRRKEAEKKMNTYIPIPASKEFPRSWEKIINILLALYSLRKSIQNSLIWKQRLVGIQEVWFSLSWGGITYKTLLFVLGTFSKMGLRLWFLIWEMEDSSWYSSSATDYSNAVDVSRRWVAMLSSMSTTLDLFCESCQCVFSRSSFTLHFT